MKQQVSAAIGIVGGIVDIAAGFVNLQLSPMGMQSMMAPASWIGYFLLVLGFIVLLSGLYLHSARMMKNRGLFGWLMIIYGLIMLALGFGMAGQLFSMMVGSTISGSVMIIVGVAMLYTGHDMARMQ